MSSEIFDAIAVEAALDAYETFPSSKLARMQIALEIAVGSLRERGMLRDDGKALKSHWDKNELFVRCDISEKVESYPVVIIRLPKEIA